VHDHLNLLFARVSAAQFVDRYFHQLPLAVPGGAERIIPLGTLDALRTIASCPEAKLERSRRGQWWPDDIRPTFEDLMASLDDGWTIFVRHAERFHPQIGELACEFRRAFQAPIDVHFFCTPAATEGFGWHYDVEDVFILQTHGAKKYRLRKNTVNPWPLVETTPADLSYQSERSLPMDCSLSAGDWLYIPQGYWHATQAEELSISLSVGVMSPTAIDVFDALRPLLVESLRWRQRLPLLTDLARDSSAGQQQRLQEVIADLANDLSRQLKSEDFLSRYVQERRRLID
jgi:ribosomal protein L16 Arg81 hydroxylase